MTCRRRVSVLRGNTFLSKQGLLCYHIFFMCILYCIYNNIAKVNIHNIGCHVDYEHTESWADRIPVNDWHRSTSRPLQAVSGKTRISLFLCRFFLLSVDVYLCPPVLGKIRSAVGSAQLLMSQKFQQFYWLCQQNLVSIKCACEQAPPHRTERCKYVTQKVTQKIRGKLVNGLLFSEIWVGARPDAALVLLPEIEHRDRWWSSPSAAKNERGIPIGGSPCVAAIH